MKLLAKAVFMSALLVSAALAGSEDTFRSVTVGFEVTKPNAWRFVSAQQHLENLKRTKLDNQEFHQAMLKYSTAPLVSMMKHPEPFDDLNPSFKVNIKPFGDLKGSDPKQILTAISFHFKNVFKDLEIVETPTDRLVSGIVSGYMKINFSVEVPDGRTYPTTSELWIVPRGDFFFLIGAGTRQDEKTGSRKEIQEILETIIIEL